MMVIGMVNIRLNHIIVIQLKNSHFMLILLFNLKLPCQTILTTPVQS
jgi:hypothetical protein